MRDLCVLLPLLYLVMFLAVGQPLTLVLIGALAQAIMLPLLCLAALYFHYRQTDVGVADRAACGPACCGWPRC